MILPVSIYNHPVLRLKCSKISSDYDNLSKLINDMYETMHNANGVGLAAPQIGLSISLFIIDLTPFLQDYPDLKTTKKVFINPEIQKEDGDEWVFNEGCLSIPEIREDISRKEKIKIKYFDRNFNVIEENIEGIEARVIQHEYDHLQGVLFIDFLSGERKNIINRKLKNINKGKFDKNYPYKLFKK
jgi:peptide deformylase